MSGGKITLDFHLETWMGDLRHVIGQLPLAGIAMPGSHDAGAYNLGSRAAPFAPSITRHRCAGCFRCVVKKFAVAQTGNLYAQLLSGSRYLDLRVTYDARSDALRTEHGLYGDNLESVFQQLSDFLIGPTESSTCRQECEEIVVLHLRHFSMQQYWDMGTEMRAAVVRLLQKFVPAERMVRPSELGLSYSDLRRRGRNLVILFDERGLPDGVGKIADFLVPQSEDVFLDRWYNVQCDDDLIRGMRDFLENVSALDRRVKGEQGALALSKLDACTTPDTRVIAHGVLGCILCALCRLVNCRCHRSCRQPTSLAELADRLGLRGGLMHWLQEFRKDGYRINIVSVNHVVREEETFGLATEIVRLNFVPLERVL